MLFISTPESDGEQRGLRKGIESMLRARFGSEALRLMAEINKVCEEDKLQAILEALETAASPEQVRPIWATELTK